MKMTVHKLRVGDLIRAQIIEVIGAGDELIVSFQGDLIRVQNKSLSTLRGGDKILVRVTQTAPLFFQLVSEDDEKRGATRINLQV
jgi:c-di-AMP phosphodiesterase-like protein